MSIYLWNYHADTKTNVKMVKNSRENLEEQVGGSCYQVPKLTMKLQVLSQWNIAVKLLQHTNGTE